MRPFALSPVAEFSTVGPKLLVQLEKRLFMFFFLPSEALDDLRDPWVVAERQHLAVGTLSASFSLDGALEKIQQLLLSFRQRVHNLPQCR